jgi:uncharacterized protein (DUF2147 family)
MRRSIRFLTTWFCLATVVHAASPVEPIVGRYLSEDEDHRIELFLREEVLYGRIVWTKDARLTDKQNKDPKLRSRKVAGVEHIRAFTKAPDGSWSGGTLYNPEDGDTYDATLWLRSENRLVIQGKPKVRVLGSILGALFGRIAYSREGKP